MARSRAPRPHPEELEMPSNTGRDQLTILVVDDDAQVRDLVSEYLRDFGYLVIEAPGAREALRVLERHETPDLMITDIRMPEMTGIELAAAVEQRGQPMKIIFMSGYSSANSVREPLLRKPFRLAELETAVRAQLRG
jgi:CheY-like chemotaxis protein